ncbi:MAG: polysaccharide biosynthesis tyrosine autokinase [Thermotogae bacterium]|nr:polysaccharide biosynthesis tyrosine autokinase [Thermotogota bacterium]
MEKEFEAAELTLSDIVHIFRKRWVWFLLTLIGVLALTGVYLMLATPIYEASTTIKIESSSGGSVTDIFTTTYGLTGRSNISTEVELIKSKTNLERVVKELELLEILRKNNPEITLNKAVKILDDWITVTPVKDTKLVRISVQHPDPSLAAKIANKLAEVYNDLLKTMAKNKYTVRREFIEQQIPKIERDLKDAEERIRKFKEENNVFVLNEEAKWILQMMSQYDNQLNNVNIQIEESKARIKAIKELLSKVEKKIVSSETISMNPVVLQLKQRLTDLNVRLSGLLATRPESDAEVVALKRQIMETENLIKKEVEKLITSEVQVMNPVYSSMVKELAGEEAGLQVLMATKQAVEKLKEEYQAKLSTLPKLEQKLLELQRELKIKESLYTLLLEKLEETRIAEAGVIGNAQIVDKASPPEIPVKPNKKLTLAIGGVLGMFLGILVVFAAEYMDKTLKDEDEIQRIIKNVLILGRIPNVSDSLEKNRVTSELVVKEHPVSPVAENFKLVSTNLQFMSSSKKQVICVSSAEKGEGKTFVSVNLAITFAQNGFKTLIVDLDMRRPRVEKVFGITKKYKMGIVNHLAKNVPLEEIIVNYMENLDIIPVGPLPPNPTILLTSQKFFEVMKYLKERYDKILIDLPPLLAAADALIVGKHSDGILLVVRITKSHKMSLRIAHNNIETSGNKLIGVVLNDITRKSSQYYYYYYYEDGKRRKRRVKKAQEIPGAEF